MIDADSNLVDDRIRQLERALRDAEEPLRTPGEPILNLIPKRSVETWILCLNSNQVDELTNYRHDPGVHPQSIGQAASVLFSWTRRNVKVSNSCVSSLKNCLPEFDRIPD
jgi:hypothetical protein